MAPPYIIDTQIHLSRFVFKDTQLCHLLGNVVSIALCVCVRNAHQQHKTRTNRSHRLTVYPNGGLSRALYNHSHSCYSF